RSAGRAATAPGGRLLVGVPGAEDGRLVPAAPDELKRQRQAVRGEAAAYGKGGYARHVGRRGQGGVLEERERGHWCEAGRGREGSGAEEHVLTLERLIHLEGEPPAQARSLHIVGTGDE